MRAAVPHEDSVGVSNVLKLSASWMRRVSGRFHRHQLDPAVSQKTTTFRHTVSKPICRNNTRSGGLREVEAVRDQRPGA